jgi:AP-2 complex subunit beta-1
LTPAQLPPTVIHVPGPGPNESHSAQSELLTADNPELPEAVASKPSLNQDGEDNESDQDEGNAEPQGGPDPYSNLDGAFSNYLVDEPQPIAASNRAGRHNDLDDLLF